jgi:DNA (cytosine-5)-methyltransferase 1
MNGFPPSLQNLGRSCEGEARDVWRYLVQIHASGIRANRAIMEPLLVAMTTSHLPAVAMGAAVHAHLRMRQAPEQRSLRLPAIQASAVEALGDAVDVEAVKAIARQPFAAPPEVDQLRPAWMKHAQEQRRTTTRREVVHAG